ncbi:unnamed protein product [Meganyctiphanes norvegica]|uniref:Uncharacterized protein n=1 Tax=Meganyctiphanes norvegica TaxID=48144 RepID=A0AAV2PZ01_MEGNR
MVLSSINQTKTQSVTPFGSFSGSTSADVSPVISSNKSQNEQPAVIKTPTFLINNIANGKLALKSTKKNIKTPKPKEPNPLRILLSTLGTPEFEQASKKSVLKPSYDKESSDAQYRSASIGTPTHFARRLPCNFKPEEPLPPIFSIFD